MDCLVTFLFAVVTKCLGGIWLAVHVYVLGFFCWCVVLATLGIILGRSMLRVSRDNAFSKVAPSPASEWLQRTDEITRKSTKHKQTNKSNQTTPKQTKTQNQKNTHTNTIMLTKKNYYIGLRMSNIYATSLPIAPYGFSRLAVWPPKGQDAAKGVTRPGKCDESWSGHLLFLFSKTKVDLFFLFKSLRKTMVVPLKTLKIIVFRIPGLDIGHSLVIFFISPLCCCSFPLRVPSFGKLTTAVISNNSRDTGINSICHVSRSVAEFFKNMF